MPKRKTHAHLRRAPPGLSRSVEHREDKRPDLFFSDPQTGVTLDLARYYGFGDAGGLAGAADGYSTLDEALRDIQSIYPGDDIGTTPEQLGVVTLCIITGQQYLDRLRNVGGFERPEVP